MLCRGRLEAMVVLVLRFEVEVRLNTRMVGSGVNTRAKVNSRPLNASRGSTKASHPRKVHILHPGPP